MSVDILFLSILNMSLTGAFVIAVICLARQLLKKAPKAISYALWAVVGFRLVFPITIESFFSLIRFNPAPIPLDIATQAVPHIDSGIPIVGNAVNNAVNTVIPAAAPYYSVNPLQVWIAVGAWVWFIVAMSLMVYGVVSFFALKRKMKNAACVESNIYEADSIKSPFVLGVFSPKIYLPVGLFGQEREYILLHEQMHIRRRDHIVKFAAYFVLCLHWFNPLAWLAFWLMSADMEMSCDERVMKELGDDICKDYSMSLVRIATGRRILTGSPLAFGEGGIKERVKRVLNFQKPTRMIVVLSIALVALLSVGLAVNLTSANDTTIGGNPPYEGVFILENWTDRDRFTRLLSVSLNPDGRASLATPPISSYRLGATFFFFSDDELLIHYESGDIIAKFEVVDERTLIFRESAVPLFADVGARYVFHPRVRLTNNEDNRDISRTYTPSSDGTLSPEILDQIYLGMTNERVRELFGEPDFHASGLNWYGYNDIGIFDPTSSTTGVVERISLASGISWSVRELISTAVKQHYAGHFYDADGSFAAEAHTILALDANPQGFTAYVVSLYMRYLPDGTQNVREISGGHSHLVLTFSRSQSNQYELVEFWEPESGTNHMPSIHARFPENTWSNLDTQRFINAHSAVTREQAMLYFFGELTNTARTAESTLHEAFFEIFKAVYDFNYALNHNIRYIAVDVSDVFYAVREPLLAMLEAWCGLEGYELLVDTFDGLTEAGLIARLPNTSGFRTGVLFNFYEASFDGETLTVSASKWRSPRGATGSEFSARFDNGDWIIENTNGWWMS